MKTEDRHWTEDNEMLEQFVLDRMNAAERVEAERHLRVCESCRQAVRTEQGLAAGVRRLGRDELKRKIGLRADRFEVPWPKVIRAAAMIGILTSVGIYNHWFASKEISQTPFTEEPITPAKPDSPVDQIYRRDSNEPGESVQRGAQLKNEVKAASPEVQPPVKKEKVSAGKKMQEQESVAPAPEGFAQAVDEPKATESGELVGGVQMDAKQLLEKSVWLEGTRTYAEEDKSFQARPYSFNKDIDRRKTADLQYSARSENQGNLASIGRQEITLRQQPASSLPPLWQQAKKTSGREPIQTLVEQTAKGLQLTLFLPAEITEESLQNADIQQIGDDSLVINLKGQQIGYKLPPGWNLQKQGTGVRK